MQGRFLFNRTPQNSGRAAFFMRNLAVAGGSEFPTTAGGNYRIVPAEKVAGGIR